MSLQRKSGVRFEPCYLTTVIRSLLLAKRHSSWATRNCLGVSTQEAKVQFEPSRRDFFSIKPSSIRKGTSDLPHSVRANWGNQNDRTIMRHFAKRIRSVSLDDMHSFVRPAVREPRTGACPYFDLICPRPCHRNSFSASVTRILMSTSTRDTNAVSSMRKVLAFLRK